jgi:amyloid beta precursor protein binding protein 1
MLLKSFGFLGLLRLQTAEHPIIESHPDNDRFDLYLHPDQLKTFPALQKYCEGFPVLDKDAKSSTSDEKMVHAHIPYAVILVHELKKWMKAHGGKMPVSWDECKEFKAHVKAGSWDYAEEGNYQEAVEFAQRVYKKFTLDPLTQAVINDPKAATTTKDASHFWILVRGLREFMEKEGQGCLPVSTNIPDMQSDSKSYVTLKDLYKQKAAEDTKAVASHVAMILKSVGRKETEIDAEHIDLFVRNARNLRCVRTRSLAQEYDAKTFLTQETNDVFEEAAQEASGHEEDPDKEPNPHNVNWYFALRAADVFMAEHKRKPGQPKSGSSSMSVDELKADTDGLVKIEEKIYADCGITSKVETACPQEIVRQGGTELHNVAAFLGGVASQEGLKTLLGQYVPINHTFLFNAIHGSASTLTL